MLYVTVSLRRKEEGVLAVRVRKGEEREREERALAVSGSFWRKERRGASCQIFLGREGSKGVVIAVTVIL